MISAKRFEMIFGCPLTVEGAPPDTERAIPGPCPRYGSHLPGYVVADQVVTVKPAFELAPAGGIPRVTLLEKACNAGRLAWRRRRALSAVWSLPSLTIPASPRSPRCGVRGACAHDAACCAFRHR